MSKNYMNDSQASEIVKYISDNMKLPLIGAGGGFAPIGKEGYIDGTLAPQGWLICDGSTHNIADYPDLAAYYASHHGASNYYGGDGITTFAVPVRNGMPTSDVDSPDEHIVSERRKTVDGVLKFKPVYEKMVDIGALPNSTTKTVAIAENIEEVVKMNGVATNGSYTQVLPNVSNDTRYLVAIQRHNDNIDIISTQDWSSYNGVVIVLFTKTTDSWQTVQEGHSADGNGVFCVKATLSDAEINAFNVYTPREHQVGWWEEEIDGVWKRKPVYEKVINTTLPNQKAWTNIDTIQDAYDGWMVQSFTRPSNVSCVSEYGTINIRFNQTANGADVDVLVLDEYRYGKPATLTIQYLKTTDQWQTS